MLTSILTFSNIFPDNRELWILKNAVLFFSIFFPRPFHLLFSNFVSFWAAWVLVAVWAFSSRSAGRGYSVVGARRPLAAERRLQGPWAQQLWPAG